MARKKRTYGTGSTYQNKAGEWFAAFPGEQGRITRRVADESAGKAWLAEMAAQEARHVNVMKAQDSFHTYAETFMGTLRKQKETTIVSYAQLLEYYVLDFVGGVRLADLRKAHFSDMVCSLLDAGNAVSQVRNALNLAARILDKAMGDDLVLKNYAALARDELPAAEESVGRALTVEEAAALVETVASHRLAPLYHIALCYGVRKGELLGLRWIDIDWTAGTFHIRQQVREVPILGAADDDPHTKIIYSEPKSKGSKRLLPLTSLLYDRLRAVWDEQQEQRARLGVEWKEHGLVFPSEAGQPIRPTNFRKHYKVMLRKAGIDETYRFHDLRHTAATMVADAGMEESVIAHLLGHGKTTVTRRYIKALHSQMLPALEAVEVSIGLGGQSRKEIAL